jgi:hypothetical protein
MLDAKEFLVTALWSTTGYDDEHLDSKFSVDDVPQEFVDKCQSVCDDFMAKASHLFTEDEIDASAIEHDLWLTIHGHGAGFWDGDYEKGDELTEIAKSFQELEDELREALT